MTVGPPASSSRTVHARILGQPVGEHAARRTGADDDVLVRPWQDLGRHSAAAARGASPVMVVRTMCRRLSVFSKGVARWSTA